MPDRDYYKSELYRVRRKHDGNPTSRMVSNASDNRVGASRPKNIFDRVLTYLTCLQNGGLDTTEENIISLAVMDNLICPCIDRSADVREETAAALSRLIDRGLLTVEREVDDYFTYESSVTTFYHALARRRPSPWGFALWQLVHGIFDNDTVSVSSYESGRFLPVVMRRALDSMIEVSDRFYDICRKEAEQPASNIFWRFGFYATLTAQSKLQDGEELNIDGARVRNQLYGSRHGIAPDGLHRRGVIWYQGDRLADYMLLGSDVTAFQWHLPPTYEDSLQVLWEMMSSSDAKMLPADLARLFDPQALSRACRSTDTGDRILPSCSLMRMREHNPK